MVHLLPVCLGNCFGLDDGRYLGGSGPRRRSWGCVDQLLLHLKPGRNYEEGRTPGFEHYVEVGLDCPCRWKLSLAWACRRRRDFTE